MSLRDFWKKIDVMAEEQRLKIPVWCVWLTQDPDEGYFLYRTVTREEAIARFRAEELNPTLPWLEVSCSPATQRQVDDHQRVEREWGGSPGPVSPHKKMGRV